uniref:Uncharacterized protein n=1 Tax=Sphaerodactylus townsendi TaxID=933632 RepID=A0ACB8E9K5_9SAUR
MHKNKQSSLVMVVVDFSRVKLLLCVHFCQSLQHPRKLELDCSVANPEVYPPSRCPPPPKKPSHIAPNHQGHKVGSTVKSKEGLKRSLEGKCGAVCFATS